MKIAKDVVVTLRQRVTDLDGAVVDDGAEPVSYLHGGYHDIFDRIESALDGKSVGDEVSVRLEPKEAFGEYDPEQVVVAGFDQFTNPPQPGEMVERGGELYRVVELRDDSVVLDGNHPFAGLHLIFQGEVQDVRPARAEEITRIAKSVTVEISRLRAIKMATIHLLGVPIVLTIVAGTLSEAMGGGLLLYLALMFVVAVLLSALWSGGRYVREAFRGGEVLRIDVKGLYWRDFGSPVTWEEIAKVQFTDGMGEDAWYSVALTDGRNFKLDASILSVETSQISWLLAHYLPATKLKGI